MGYELTIQPRSGDGGDEELGALSVGASVGHTEVSRLSVLDLEVLIYCEPFKGNETLDIV